jgi:hypothetical protein
MYVDLMTAVWAETCSSTEDYEQVCESERIINKKYLGMFIYLHRIAGVQYFYN